VIKQVYANNLEQLINFLYFIVTGIILSIIFDIFRILRKTIKIEANSPTEAEIKAKQLYRNSEIILNSNDFIGEPTIKCIDKK
jgi:hypothetical protein